MKEVNEGGIYAKSRSAWRKWLMKNHLEKDSVWLIYYKKNSGLPSVSYQEAVEEALCFGWIDSKSQSIDEKCYRQYFSRRKPKSVWSAVNKKKVADLIRQGLMKEAGFQSIELAKKNGAWNTLDKAEALVVPIDLRTAWKENPQAKKFFQLLSRSDKKNILQWLAMAKTEPTKNKPINEIIEQALKGNKPKPFQAVWPVEKRKNGK